MFDRLDAGTNLINAFGLSLYAPVATLVFASAALSDPVDDGTLVYLWLRPVPRWRIGLAALLATWTVTFPMVLGPLVLAAVLSGGGSALVRGTLLSAGIAVIAYGALFVLLGLWVRRALLWGLAYILLWEGFVAIAGENAQRLAIRSYTRSLLQRRHRRRSLPGRHRPCGLRSWCPSSWRRSPSPSPPGACAAPRWPEGSAAQLVGEVGEGRAVGVVAAGPDAGRRLVLDGHAPRRHPGRRRSTRR